MPKPSVSTKFQVPGYGYKGLRPKVRSSLVVVDMLDCLVRPDNDGGYEVCKCCPGLVIPDSIRNPFACYKARWMLNQVRYDVVEVCHA